MSAHTKPETMRRIGTLIIILAAGLCGTQAQTTVKLTLADNSAQRYVFASDGGVYFGNGVLTVKSDATTEVGAVPLAEVSRMVFRSGDVSVAEAANSRHIRLFPNPSHDFFTVTGVGEEGCKAVVYTMVGQEVVRQHCTEGMRVDISHLRSGVYVVRLGGETVKIVKH